MQHLAFFGKLPSVGDFLSDGLNAEAHETLDHWLTKVISEGVGQHGEQWRQHYFDMRVHAFVLGSHCLGPAQELPAAGILMPSVDKAGRLFPFIALLQPTSGPAGQLGQADLQNMLMNLAKHCAQALEEEWPLSELKQACVHPLHQCQPNEGKFDQYICVGGVTQLQHAPPAGCADWFSIDLDHGLEFVTRCAHWPTSRLFDFFMGLSSQTT